LTLSEGSYIIIILDRGITDAERASRSEPEMTDTAEKPSVVNADDPRIVHALGLAIERGEVGVQVAAFLGNKCILNAALGHVNNNGTELADISTLFSVFSVTKAITSLAVHIQAHRGLIDYEQPVATYWPEFAQRGKGDVQIRDVLVHRSGIPHIPSDTTPFRLSDWDWMVNGVASLPLLAPPGSKSLYQALSFGWILGEVVRRTDPQRRSFAEFVADEVFSVVGVSDFYLGIPDSESSRVATLCSAGGMRPEVPKLRSLAIPAAVDTVPAIFNLPAVRRACVPAAGGIATAESVARCFSIIAMGGRVGDLELLSMEQIRGFAIPRDNSAEYDEVIGYSPYIGSGGFWLGGESPPAEMVVGRNPSVLCQTGAGGSIAWADPDTGLAAAICHNRMFRRNPPLEPSEHPFVPLGEAIRSLAGEGKRQPLRPKRIDPTNP
jgi:CubicO group peptidase (beta-lactamase class C family)